MTIRNVINALGCYVIREASYYEQTDVDFDIPQPKKAFLVVLLAIVVALMYVDAFRNLNKVVSIAFELVVIVGFILVVSVLCFIVLPAIMGVDNGGVRLH